MKRLALQFIFISLIVSMNMFSQPVTIISGKVKNFDHNNYAELAIETFDIETLEKKDINIESRIDRSTGTFQFMTNDIIRKYQTCRLRLSWNETILFLSPGDSIYIKANLPDLEQSIEFKGKGAERNNYRKEYNLNFIEYNTRKEIQQARAFEPVDFLIKIEKLINEKQLLLKSYLQKSLIDTEFYNDESVRLKYLFLVEVLWHFESNSKKYFETNSLSKLDSLIEKADINNQELIYCDYYRMFMEYYVFYGSCLNNKKSNANIFDKIDFAKGKLSGNLFRYVVKKLIEGYAFDANNKTELAIVLKKLDREVNDPLLAETINHHLRYVNRNRWDTELSAGAFVTLLVVLLFFILIFLAKRLQKGYKPLIKNKWTAALIIYCSYILAIILIIFFLEDIGHRYTPYFASHFLLMVIIYVIHTFIVVPKLFYRKNRYLYFISLGLLLIATIAVAQITRSMALEKRISWDNSYEVSIYSQAWLAVTLLYSWFGYFMHFLAKRGLPLSYLFKEKKVNSEIMLVVLTLVTINIIFAVNIWHGAKLSEILTFYAAIGIFLIQTFWFVPKLLFQKKYIEFLLNNIVLLVCICIGMIFTSGIHSAIALSSNGIKFNIIDLLNVRQSIHLDKLLSSILIIAPASFYNYIKYLIQERENEGFRLYRNKEAELMHLRSQVNPHFLFNNLNTLYSFALKEKSEKTAESIAKLANLMRYMIDDMDNETIPLKKEVSYIEDYIKLQSIRSSVEHNIVMNVEIDCEVECVIAPMLLIPFVENAFKHGINPNKKSELLIDIKGNKNEMQFVIENNVDKKFEAFYKEKGFGIGIENVKKRLEYLYFNKHNISIAETDKRFIVIISIKLNS